MATGDYRILQENGSGGFDEKTVATVANKYLGFDGSKNPIMLDAGSGDAATATLTNKRITKRVTSETSSATPTINTDNCDIHKITALATNITSMTTNLSGTPTDGQPLIIQITGTAARTITWGSSFESSTVTLPSTTVSTNRLDVGFLWNSATSKWRCVAVA